jgi:hypothetical protein
VVLDDYAGLTWSDIAAERGDGIFEAIRGFLSRRSALPSVRLPEQEAKSPASPTASAASACRSCCCRSIYRLGNGSR